MNFPTSQCIFSFLDTLMQKLREISDLDHSSYDCFVLFVLTHAINKSSHDSSSLSPWMNVKLLSVDMMVFDCVVLFDIFSNSNCPTLSGKPKLYFMDFCREYKKKCNYNGSIWQDSSRLFSKDQDAFYRDCLVCNSSSSGHSLYADQLNGSLFIRVLCETLGEIQLMEKFDICQLLTIVIDRISEHSYQISGLDVASIQQPTFFVLLLKKFRFRLFPALTDKFYSNIVIPNFTFGTTSQWEYDEYDLFWPDGICFDYSTENLLIADGGHDRIMFFSKEGIFLKSIYEKLSRPHGLCIWRDILISTQWHGNCITYHCLNTGRFIREFGSVGKSHGNFNRPTGVELCCRARKFVCSISQPLNLNTASLNCMNHRMYTYSMKVFMF